MNRILVVDDMELVRAELRQALEMSGYTVEEAKNGIEALEIMKSYQPDLIITDIVMPDMDGVEIIRKLRNTGVSTKIIAISDGGSRALHSYLSAAEKLGADAVCPKPFKINDLLDTVKRELSE